MSIEEKRQADFYAWFDAEVAPNITGCRAVIFAMCEKGWNAALDSVVIELPKDIEPSEVDGLDDRPLMNAAAVQHAIESAGLKVKP